MGYTSEPDGKRGGVRDWGVPVSLMGAAREAGDAAHAADAISLLPRSEALLLRADALMGIAAARAILDGTDSGLRRSPCLYLRLRLLLASKVRGRGPSSQMKCRPLSVS